MQRQRRRFAIVRVDDCRLLVPITGISAGRRQVVLDLASDVHLWETVMSQRGHCGQNTCIQSVAAVVEQGDIHAQSPNPGARLNAERFGVHRSADQESPLQNPKDAVGFQSLHVGCIPRPPASSSSATLLRIVRNWPIHHLVSHAAHWSHLDRKLNLAVVRPVRVRGRHELCVNARRGPRVARKLDDTLAPIVAPAEGQADRPRLRRLPPVETQEG